MDIVFNNDKSASVDLKESIFNDKRSIFSQLKNLNDFRSFSLSHSTIVWSEELDLAPEYIYFQAFKNNPELQPQFKEWGYRSGVISPDKTPQWHNNRYCLTDIDSDRPRFGT